MVIIVLILVLVFLVAIYHYRSKIMPWCDPVPPPKAVKNLDDSETTTQLGVPNDMIRAIYSVVQSPECHKDPDKPQAKSVPDQRDTRHITTQATRRMSQNPYGYEFHAGNIVYSIVYVDSDGVGTYYTTYMIHELKTSITTRVSMKSRMKVGSDDPPRIINMSFDPQDTEQDASEPCSVGRVPSSEPEQLDTSIYTI